MKFSVIGISHWKSAVSVREDFYLTDQKKQALIIACKEALGGALIVDTCNRTEIYAFAEASLVRSVFLSISEINPDLYSLHCYEKEGKPAFQHLYSVALGLDSQILGDVQIVQQVKAAYKHSIGRITQKPFHTLLQSVFRAHKRSRHETDFAKGTASVGFAATQQALHHFGDLSNVNILLIGAGKMGKISCKNLISNGARHLTVVNRTIEKAQKLSESMDIVAHAPDKLQDDIQNADLIISAVGGEQPILRAEHFNNVCKPLFIIDLGMPRNIHKDVGCMENITLMDMDRLNEITLEGVERRKKSIPLVQKIISEELNAFLFKIHRDEIIKPRIEAVRVQLNKITDEELLKAKTKLDPGSFEELERTVRRIHNKIIAEHIKGVEERMVNENISN